MAVKGLLPHEPDEPGESIADLPEWLSMDDLSGYLGVSKSTLYKWRSLGGNDFPYYVRLPNRQIRVHRDDVRVWMYQRQVSTPLPRVRRRR